jgi:type IV pilus assembly protein PilQ
MKQFFFALTLFATLALSQQSPVTVASEQKMSIDVKDTDIRDAIRLISKGYNINILLDQDITGKVTLHLVDVPIMEGLRSIASSNNLDVIRDGSVYYIKKASVEQTSMIRFSNGKLTVDVQNVDVRDFLKEISSKSAVSIVPDAKVEGRISGKLFQVSLDDGLRALLEGNGYTVVKRKNIYQVSQLNERQGSGENSVGGLVRGKRSSNNLVVDYSNGLVSVDVVNGDLEEIIRAIADQSDAEIITYGSIKSEINAKLNSVPLTEALALLLAGTRFTFVQKDNVILIGDRNTATPSGIALSKSELIHLKHIKADNIPAILPKDIPATNVRVIKEQNALLISGTSEDIVSATEFLKTIDIPTPQVRIDAVIVEFKENLDKEFGLRGGFDWRLFDSSYVLTPTPKTLYTESNQNFEIGINGAHFKEMLEPLFGNGLPSLLKKIPDDFFGVLRFLESQGKAKVLAQPSILTLNGNKASIDVSETQYFKVETGVGENHTSRFQPIKFGIQLDIVPWISQSGQITAEITPNVSNSEKTNNEGYPDVSTRSITTTVRLNDGQTLILGGLIKNQETTFSYKIPFLGDLPLLGILFRHSGKTRSKSNLIVFITPHIVMGDSHVNLAKELEQYEIHDMNIIEKSIYEKFKKMHPVKNKTGDSLPSDTTTVRHSDSGTSAVPLSVDTTAQLGKESTRPLNGRISLKKPSYNMQPHRDNGALNQPRQNHPSAATIPVDRTASIPEEQQSAKTTLPIEQSSAPTLPVEQTEQPALNPEEQPPALPIPIEQPPAPPPVIPSETSEDQ